LLLQYVDRAFRRFTAVLFASGAPGAQSRFALCCSSQRPDAVLAPYTCLLAEGRPSCQLCRRCIWLEVRRCSLSCVHIYFKADMVLSRYMQTCRQPRLPGSRNGGARSAPHADLCPGTRRTVIASRRLTSCVSTPAGTRRAVHVYAAAVEEEREEARPRCSEAARRSAPSRAVLVCSGKLRLSREGLQPCFVTHCAHIECAVQRAYVAGP